MSGSYRPELNSSGPEVMPGQGDEYIENRLRCLEGDGQRLSKICVELVQNRSEKGPLTRPMFIFRHMFPRPRRVQKSGRVRVCCSPPSLMQSLAQLRSTLLSFSTLGTVDDERELFELLVSALPSLLNLFDVPPRSETEQKNLREGVYKSCSFP